MVYLGLSLTILIYLDIFSISVYLGLSRAMLKNLKLSQVILTYLWMTQAISCFPLLFLAISLYLRISWDISGYMGLLFAASRVLNAVALLKYFCTFLTDFWHFWTDLNILGTILYILAQILYIFILILADLDILDQFWLIRTILLSTFVSRIWINNSGAQ